MSNPNGTYDFRPLGSHLYERLSLKELSYFLDYQTISSVKGWCKRHKIQIHKDGGKNYIFRYEFDRVNLETIIGDLKSKYGENWEEAWEALKTKQFDKLSFKAEPHSIHSIPRYKPKSVIAQKL